MGKRRRRKEYVRGYEHYGHKRTVPVLFYLNEAEKCCLDDLAAVLGVRNMSEFIRGQVFKAYSGLTEEQKRQMAEVAEWRAEEDPACHAGQ